MASAVPSFPYLLNVYDKPNYRRGMFSKLTAGVVGKEGEDGEVEGRKHTWAKCFICLSPHGAISAPYVMRQKGSIGFQVRKMCQVDEKLCLFGKMLDSNFNIQHRVLTCLRNKSTAGVNGRYVSFCRCFIFNVINTLSVCSLVYL